MYGIDCKMFYVKVLMNSKFMNESDWKLVLPLDRMKVERESGVTAS